MSLTTDLVAATALVSADSSLLHQFVNGPASGPGSIITTESGDIYTLARLQQTVQTLPVSGALFIASGEASADGLAYTMTTDAAWTSWVLDRMLLFTCPLTNTGSCTIVVNGLTFKLLLDKSGLNIAPGLLKAGVAYLGVVSATNAMRLIALDSTLTLTELQLWRSGASAARFATLGDGTLQIEAKVGGVQSIVARVDQAAGIGEAGAFRFIHGVLGGQTIATAYKYFSERDPPDHNLTTTSADQYRRNIGGLIPRGQIEGTSPNPVSFPYYYPNVGDDEQALRIGVAGVFLDCRFMAAGSQIPVYLDTGIACTLWCGVGSAWRGYTGTTLALSAGAMVILHRVSTHDFYVQFLGGSATASTASPPVCAKTFMMAGQSNAVRTLATAGLAGIQERWQQLGLTDTVFWVDGATSGSALLKKSGDWAYRAFLLINPDGLNNELMYGAKVAGRDGNLISIVYIDPAAPGAALSVSVADLAITVNLATDAGGLITSTAASILAAVAASTAANALVNVINFAHSTGAGLVTAMPLAFLAGADDTTYGNYWWDSDLAAPGPCATNFITQHNDALALGQPPVAFIEWEQGQAERAAVAIGVTTPAEFLNGHVALFAWLRAQVGDAALPIFVNPIGNNDATNSQGAMTAIREAHCKVPTLDSRAYHGHETFDLWRYNDNAHFSHMGYRESGRRLASYIGNLLYGKNARRDFNTLGPHIVSFATIDASTYKIVIDSQGYGAMVNCVNGQWIDALDFRICSVDVATTAVLYPIQSIQALRNATTGYFELTCILKAPAPGAARLIYPYGALYNWETQRFIRGYFDWLPLQAYNGMP